MIAFENNEGSQGVVIDINSFCDKITTFVALIMETEDQKKVAEGEMQRVVENRFKGLTKEMLLVQANRKTIIRTVIRKAWPSILEQLYILVDIVPGVTWDNAELQVSITKFKETYESMKESNVTYETSSTGKNDFNFIYM